MQAGNAILKDATQTITPTSATTSNCKRAISIDEQDTPVPKRRAENTENSPSVKRALDMMIPSGSPAVAVSWIEG